MNFASCWFFKFPFERKTPSRQHFFELYLKLPSIPLKQQWSISYVDNSYLYCYVTHNMRGACILRVLELVVYFLTIFIWGVQIFQVNYRLYTGRCVIYKTPCMKKKQPKNHLNQWPARHSMDSTCTARCAVAGARVFEGFFLMSYKIIK